MIGPRMHVREVSTRWLGLVWMHLMPARDDWASHVWTRCQHAMIVPRMHARDVSTRCLCLACMHAMFVPRMHARDACASHACTRCLCLACMHATFVPRMHARDVCASHACTRLAIAKRTFTLRINGGLSCPLPTLFASVLPRQFMKLQFIKSFRPTASSRWFRETLRECHNECRVKIIITLLIHFVRLGTNNYIPHYWLNVH